ncbi:AbrB/MazE/SpoVT family DNA-binding domain-containing protein [Azospirillum argentinense]
MLTLRLVSIGNSVGIILPKETLSKMNVEKGDTVYLTETPDGYKITPYDPDFERQMQIAEAVMKEERNVLRELAK